MRQPGESVLTPALRFHRENRTSAQVLRMTSWGGHTCHEPCGFARPVMGFAFGSQFVGPYIRPLGGPWTMGTWTSIFPGALPSHAVI
jgi:hypothetical protein